MTPDITTAAALIGGLVSFLSPCVLPLVPPYLAYLAGAACLRSGNADTPGQFNQRAVFAAVLFVAGLTTVFVPLGAGASAVGGLLRHYSEQFAVLAGIAVIAMGLHLLGLLPIAALMRQVRIDVRRPVGLWGAYVMGLAFAFGWTPCIGPILAAILAIAALETTVAKGASLLAVYSLGLGLPFIAAAIVIQPFIALLARCRTYLGYTERAAGGLLVLAGIAFLTGGMQRASFWLIEIFPTLGEVG